VIQHCGSSLAEAKLMRGACCISLKWQGSFGSCRYFSSSTGAMVNKMPLCGQIGCLGAVPCAWARRGEG
jgi:hypothetical protein